MKYRIFILVPYRNGKRVFYSLAELSSFHFMLIEKDIFESKDLAVNAIRLLKSKWPSELFTVKEIL